MLLEHNVNLKSHNTFGISVFAKKCYYLETDYDVQIYFQEFNQGRDFLVVGQGSNILFSKDFEGDILFLKFDALKIFQETDQFIDLIVDAGKVWHEFVTECVKNEWCGIENLALIPGTVGASPIQNIGAYGVEVKDVIVSVIGYSILENKFVEVTNSECQFDYRNSIFKHELKNQFIITKVKFRLIKPIYYSINGEYVPVKEYLISNSITNPKISDIYKAIITIRESKLPNPKQIGNAGSFFKNPIVPIIEVQKLLSIYSNMPHYSISESYSKIPAAWLIENAGWKGYKKGDAGVFPKQALVLVNYGNATSEEILSLCFEIIQSVKEKFSIELQPEVNII